MNVTASPINPPAGDRALGTFTPLTPGRLLDTRDGTGTDGVIAPVGPDSAIELQITGRQGVPATGVTAVAINMTDVSPTRDGYLTAWPSGVGRPLASKFNFVAGQTRPNAVVVKVGANGKIALYNFAGRTDIVVDVAGYWSDAGGTPGSSYTPITPTRALDTRNGTGGAATPIGPNSSISLGMSGVSAVPSDATGVVLNIIAVGPTRAGFLTVYPTGQPRPFASTHNFGTGVTIANLVFAKSDRSVHRLDPALGEGVVAVEELSGADRGDRYAVATVEVPGWGRWR